MKLKGVDTKQWRFNHEHDWENRKQSRLQQGEDRKKKRLALDEKRVVVKVQRTEYDKEERKLPIPFLEADAKKLV